MVALDHVQAHRLAVLNHLVDQRLQLGELVDVVAVRLGLALDRRRAVRVELEPHHLRLGAHPQVQPGLGLERLVDPAQVAAAVGGQVRARVGLLLPVAEQRAEHPRGLRVPRQLAERVHVRQADELPGLGPVPDVVAVPVGEQVGGGPVDQLEAAVGDPLPVVGGHALAHDPPGDRDELVVDVGDALGVDLRADTLDRVGATVGVNEPFEVGTHTASLAASRPGQAAPAVSGSGGSNARDLRTVNPVSWDDTTSGSAVVGSPGLRAHPPRWNTRSLPAASVECGSAQETGCFGSRRGGGHWKR